MRCKACGTENESYMEFCVKCAEELPRVSVAAQAPSAPAAPAQPNNISDFSFDEFDPQPYDYRLPYRPTRGFPEGYERPKASENAPRRSIETSPEQYQQRPSPAYEPPVRPVPRLSKQMMPPIPEPQERTIDVPIIRISDPYVPPQPAQPQQHVYAPQTPPPAEPDKPLVPVPLPAAPQAVDEPKSEPIQEIDEPPVSISKRKSKQPTPPKKSRGRKRGYDDDYEDDFDDDEQPQRGGALMVVLYISIAVLLLAAVWFAGSYINEEYGSVSNFIESVFGSGDPADPNASPADKVRVEIQPTTYEGDPVHQLTFYGESGQQIELPDIGLQHISKTYTIPPAKSQQVLAPDRLFIPEEPDESTPEEIPVKLAANLIDADGQSFPLDIPEFTVKVPQATLELSQPGATNVTLEEPMLTIAGKVSTDARLFIDGSDASNALDALGNFSYTYEITEYGERTIVLEARALYQRPQKAEIVISYVKRDVAITVEGAVPDAADPYKGVLEGTTEETIEVSGTFEAGAQVTIDGALEGDPTVDSDAGTYSFVGILEGYGLKTFNINASKDGATSSFELSVEKKPDVDEYTPEAREMNYESLTENADEQIERIYICNGTITEIIQQTPYPVFIFNVGDEEEPQNILMEYYGTTPLDTEKEYRIYGDVAGMDAERSLPKLYARFIYER